MDSNDCIAEINTTTEVPSELSSGFDAARSREVPHRSKRGLKCLYKSKGWYASNRKRPLYMFPAERRTTAQLIDRMETWRMEQEIICFSDLYGWLCAGKVLDDEGNEVDCSGTKEEGRKQLPRKVTLFTLNHDLLIIVLNDWRCCKCGYENRYNGDAHGIYPAARHREFTIEVLYLWMYDSMQRGISLRSMFELLYNLQNSISYRRKLEASRIDILAPEWKRDRRLAKDANRKFCLNIDLDVSSKCTKRLFSCRKCEKQIDHAECKQLGIEMDWSSGIIRFNALVLDGKVIGALREFPVNSGEVQKIVGSKGLQSKIVNN